MSKQPQQKSKSGNQQPKFRFPSGSKVALFIDNENAFYGSLHNASSFPNYDKIVEKAEEFGLLVHAVAICDWTRLARGIPHISQAGIEPSFACHAMTAYSGADRGSKEKYDGKQSSSDGHIFVGVYEYLIAHPEVEVFVVVTGDRDFVPLIHSLRRLGKYAVVLSEEVSLAWDLKAAANEAYTFQEIDALIPAKDRDEEKKIDSAT